MGGLRTNDVAVLGLPHLHAHGLTLVLLQDKQGMDYLRSAVCPSVDYNILSCDIRNGVLLQDEGMLTVLETCCLQH